MDEYDLISEEKINREKIPTHIDNILDYMNGIILQTGKGSGVSCYKKNSEGVFECEPFAHIPTLSSPQLNKGDKNILVFDK